MNIKNIIKELELIPDPEIPILSISDLGVLRNVKEKNGKILITITPTYSGCPAMDRFKVDIKDKMLGMNLNNFEIITQHDPAWTTDWINEKAKKKLKEYGIAPPEFISSDKGAILGAPKHVTCPRCNSVNTKLISSFGSTACKAMYTCVECLEPFEYFKCL